ncbi:hypothetical protein C8R44DRAFT_777696 [Mycena epipterygia]|nr:hypothetical protein C8R44DRAFT_777696 [Mycena epipterygia]
MDSHPALGGKTVPEPRLGLPAESSDSEMADATVKVEDVLVPLMHTEAEKMVIENSSLGVKDELREGAHTTNEEGTSSHVDGKNPPVPQPVDLFSGGEQDVKLDAMHHPKAGGKTIWNTIPQSEEDEGPSTQNSECVEVNETVVPINNSDGAGWEESEESEVEDITETPSNDIRGDFECVLNGPLDFQGSFYFHKTYTDFPNPILRLGSLGHVGLPLSSREAKHVISHCIQAPFGKGERTLVDKSVRDTWEMDASQVHFDNPAWKIFMNKVRQEVCLKLGLTAGQISTVRCEPYKLLLYETGSHTEKAKGMFATVVVVLPSPFQGGAAHLSHGALSTIIDSSSHSLSTVSVLAWYTDVVHEIKPITSGHRLAIAFNLIQTANSRPVLPETNQYLQRLKHVLLSWKQRTDSVDVPVKLIYLLQHKYSLASVRGDCLKGADAYKVALLQSLAKQLSFDVGLANVECHVIGSGDDDFGHRGYDSEEDDDDVGMGEVEEQTMTIKNLVDLDGQRVQGEVECEEDDSEFCPANLRDVVEAGNPDKREYEGYQGNVWYRRTVLVIWPHRHNAEMRYGTDPARALTVLTSSGSPDKECRLLARFLLRGIVSRRFGHRTIQSLCKIACNWRDLALWLKTVSLCDPAKKLDILSARRIVDAIEVFGFGEMIQDALAKILAETPSNTTRIKLLDAIMTRAGTDRVDNHWLARQRYRVMKTLKKPELGEEELLVKLTVEGGGVPFLQNTILPQVVSTADSAFLLNFATRLVIEQSLLQTGEYIMAIRNIVRDLLTLAIDKTDFFSDVTPLSSEPAYSFIEACVKCSHGDLAELVVDKLVALANIPADTARMRTFNVLIPLIPRLSASDRPIPGLGKLCHVTLEHYMKQAGRTAPTDAQLSAILDAVVGAKDGSMASKIVNQLSTLAPSEALSRSLIKNLRSRERSILFDSNEGLSIPNICMQSVQNLVQRTNYGSNLPVIVDHIQLCLSTDNSPVLSDLFPRLLSPAITNSRYVSEVLLPLVPKIQVELASRNISSASDPFRGVFKQIFELYASKVLGPKASDPNSLVKGVKKLNCTCVDCTTLVKFFLQSPDRQLRLLKIGTPRRKHVEKNLQDFCGYRIANWRAITSSPPGLEVRCLRLRFLLGGVDLVSSIASTSIWTARQAKLKEVVGIVSKDETILRDIFGEDYGKLMKAMGQEAGADPASPPAKKTTAERLGGRD